MKAIWIGVAGFAGAVSRYTVEGWVSARSRGMFPWGTFVVNVSGCIVIGFLIALLTERFNVNPTLRTALTVGFVGAYTTFSTFAFETMRLSDHHQQTLAAIYVIASITAGLAAVYTGTRLARTI